MGDLLAQKIDISPPAARGLIKLSIKDELGPFKPYNQIDFEDLKKTFENSLKRRLIKLEVQEFESILDYIIDELTLNQSLITIGGV